MVQSPTELYVVDLYIVVESWTEWYRVVRSCTLSYRVVRSGT